MADPVPRPGAPKPAARRTQLPDLPARADLDRARLRAQAASDTVGGPGDAPERPARRMPVLRWKGRSDR